MSLAATLLGLLILTPSTRSADFPEVLIVGDSISKLTTPYVKERLVSKMEVTIFQTLGAGSTLSVETVEQIYKPSESVLVFDAGTNDEPGKPGVLARNLRKVAHIVGGDTCMVVPTLDNAANGASNNDKTKVVFEFAASRAGTQVPEWAGVVDMQPKLRLHPHGFVPNHPAATFRARMIRDAIYECFAFNRGREKVTEPRFKPVWLSQVDRVEREIKSSR